MAHHFFRVLSSLPLPSVFCCLVGSTVFKGEIMLFPSARLSGWVALGRLLCNPSSSTGKILGKRYLLWRRPKRRLWDKGEDYGIYASVRDQKSTRNTKACVQPGSRFQNSDLHLWLCRRKLVENKVNQFTAARTPYEPGLHKAAHVVRHFCDILKV
jgi:hypothetical protein